MSKSASKSTLIDEDEDEDGEEEEEEDVNGNDVDKVAAGSMDDVPSLPLSVAAPQ